MSCRLSKNKTHLNSLEKKKIHAIVAPLMIAKTWKQLKCPLTEEWIKKMWHVADSFECMAKTITIL